MHITGSAVGAQGRLDPSFYVRRFGCVVLCFCAVVVLVAYSASTHLRREKKALELQADHTAQMKCQETWRMGCQRQTEVCTELNHRDALFSNIQEALACPVDHYDDCERRQTVQITRLEQICNIRIWKDYELRKDTIRNELQDCGDVSVVTSALSSQVCNWARLDPNINEVLLIYGTQNANTDQIAEFGFDPHLVGESGPYGQGVYFTDQSCKGLQYSGADVCTTGCVIIARVILGHCYNAAGPLQTKVGPLVDPSNPSEGRFHSVIVQPGTCRGGGERQVHREFVLFNGAQAYPELIVHYEIA